MRQFNISLGSLVLTVQNFWCWTFIQHRSLNKVIAILCTIWEQHFLLEISTFQLPPAPLEYAQFWKKKKKRKNRSQKNGSVQESCVKGSQHQEQARCCQISKPAWPCLVMSSKAAKDPASPLNKGENANIGIKCIEKNLFQIKPLNENLWYFCVEA